MSILERPPVLARSERYMFEDRLPRLKEEISLRVGQRGIDILNLILSRKSTMSTNQEISFGDHGHSSISDRTATDALALFETRQSAEDTAIRVRLYIPHEESDLQLDRVIVRADHGHSKSKNWVNLELIGKEKWNLSAQLFRDSQNISGRGAYSPATNQALTDFYMEIENYLDQQSNQQSDLDVATSV